MISRSTFLVVPSKLATVKSLQKDFFSFVNQLAQQPPVQLALLEKRYRILFYFFYCHFFRFKFRLNCVLCDQNPFGRSASYENSPIPKAFYRSRKSIKMVADFFFSIKTQLNKQTLWPVTHNKFVSTWNSLNLFFLIWRHLNFIFPAWDECITTQTTIYWTPTKNVSRGESRFRECIHSTRISYYTMSLKWNLLEMNAM